MAKSKLFLQLWGPALLLMVVIFGFSSIPSREMPSFGILDFVVKKGGHALGYGLLSTAYLRGLKGNGKKMIPWQILMAWILATLYSASDEFHQSFVPGRNPAVMDVMIDSLGAALALFLVYRVPNQK